MTRTFARPLAFAMLVLLGSATAGYAYGIQRHGVNQFDHGCNDPGCTGTSKAGNYNKEGFVWKPNFSTDYINTEVWDAQYDTFKVRQDCSNCAFNVVQWDTNPRWECDFKTWHVAVEGGSLALNGHYHWNESATSSSGC